MRSKTLTTNVEIIEEAQRVLINLLTDLIGPIKHVMLMEIATYENKGDPAIAAGEIMLLRKMNKTIVYYCETFSCSQEHHIRQQIAISKNYTKDNLVILMQGVVSDWTTQWISNIGLRDLETSFLVAFSGLNFIQRGRVVVTDRLHGHILSTLLNIPHVLIDNPPFLKLSSFDKSWTESVENTVLINNGTLGLEEALKLLKKYDSILPQVGPVDMNRFPKV
ncbi:hypothetical protein Btru_022442 [Bulinus truncatus]|nr:hypothetical protein Btru_022442 [Bulinus truncatus]